MFFDKLAADVRRRGLVRAARRIGDWRFGIGDVADRRKAGLQRWDIRPGGWT